MNFHFPSVTSADTVLTGDRPTGPLHLGHYAGSIATRLAIQGTCTQTLLVADLQALTDNAGNPAKVRDNVLEVATDYLACGIDPARTTVCLQSGIPELAELTMLYMNLVTVTRLERNPTVKAEIVSRGFEKSLPAGFLAYPVSQAADITAFGATAVPVGEDQLPMIEISNEIAAAVNRIAGRDVIARQRPLLSPVPRLPGIDGRSKASKSAGNAIDIRDDADTVRRKVMMMYTDPDHVRVSDPGKVEGNVVFAYLDAFDPDTGAVAGLKDRYRAGGLGDVVLKRRLADVLDAVFAPVRARRLRLAADPGAVAAVLRDGTDRARERAARTLDEVREVFGLSRRL